MCQCVLYGYVHDLWFGALLDYVYAVHMHQVSVCLYPWFCIYVFLGLSVVSVCVV